MPALRILAGVVLAVWSSFALAQAQPATVQVSVPRANVRAEASDQGAVLTQVTAGTVLTVRGVEGDWFLVEVAVGGVRLQGYISRKVAVPPGAPAASAAPPAAAAPRVTTPSHERAGITVALQTGGQTAWVVPDIPVVRRVGPAVNSVRAVIGVLPVQDVPPAAEGATPLTYVWVLPGGSAPRVLGDRRPVFLVTVNDPAGAPPRSLVPVLLRVTPTPSGVRVVAAARGRADQASVSEATWDVMRDLRQDAVRATVETIEGRTVRLVPASALEAGEYALVMRPASRAPLAGPAVLGPDSAFALAWGFSVK